MKISPHVSIYKFPIVAVSSITNRISGVALSGLYVSTGLLCLTNNIQYLENKYNNFDYKKHCDFLISLPFVYHTLGSIRHFVWDKYPKLLTNTAVKNSSIGLFASTFCISSLLIYTKK